jgi:glycosyltransferase involved in cell wall biosynthesis
VTAAQPISSPSGPIVLNGRAASRSVITGVERWAIEMTARLPALHPERYAVISPPAALAHRAGQLWEQAWLPLRTARLGGSLIWSPANIAPLAWRRNVVVVHDAAVLRHPEAYGWTYRTWHARIGLAVARMALCVMTVSDFSRRELIELAGLDPAAVVVIRGGVDERFAPAVDHERVAEAWGLKRPYVLTVATADARKNLSLLSHVATRLRGLGLDLVWAGGSRAHIAGEPPIEGVLSLGYVPEQDLPGLYAGAAAFVLPSRYEGFGLTCVEAMASGVPVVAADRAALPETCAGAALLVDPDDADATAAAVISAATDAEVGARLRAAGLRRAAQLTWDRAAHETDALLAELAASPMQR